MEPLLCFPDPLPDALRSALRRGGYDVRCVARPDLVGQAGETRDGEGWAGAVVYAGGGMDAAVAMCRHLRLRDDPVSPLLMVVGTGQLADLPLRDELFDDFCLEPVDPDELVARMELLLWRAGRGRQGDLVAHGPLVLNLETYQAAVAGRVLDLTYMEYELLKFLALNPGKVFTRDTLLNRVWGYEYYGGARTVDVHVRRLRAKLGQEHAHLIQTVRSVGYRLGQAGWPPFNGGPAPGADGGAGAAAGAATLPGTSDAAPSGPRP